MKKNILILITASSGGGAERLILDQVKYFNRDKFNIHIITLRIGILEEEFSNNKEIRYHSLNSEKKFVIKNLKRINKYIKKHNISVIHAHLIEAELIGFFIKISNPKIKLIATKHNTDQFRKYFLYRILNRIISLPYDNIIAVSDSVKKYISQYEFIPKNKIEVIYNGVDTEKFKIRKPDEKLKRQIGLDNNDFVIGIVGRLTEQKGHSILFKAVKQIGEKINNLNVIVLGDGELKENLIEETVQLKIDKKVKFLGFKKDLEKFYPLMDIFCLPSIYEGFGLVVVEAVLSGITCIASKIHGIEEIIDSDETGILFQPGNCSDLSSKICQVYMNKGNYIEIRRSSAKKISKKFDFRNSLKRLEDIYCHCCPVVN